MAGIVVRKESPGPVMEWMALPDCGKGCSEETRAVHEGVDGGYAHVFATKADAVSYAEKHQGSHRWKVRCRIVDYGQWVDYQYKKE